ncbi:alpha/beta fold hydrolase [Modestobacter altitudinis]|uniref:alpha/beta fold hydrolase n=1 Tax=Modestobacter altitudinis TaxID=2213158 RepID=UPI001FEB1606|nr:alpha/beta fold hydrolase [Modestobacter altitudinis]
MTHRRWLPTGDPRATVQVVHGASEHSGRYERLASALTARGLAVYATDLCGHGRTAEGTGTGRFGAPGVGGVLDDVRALHLVAAEQHPGLPRLLLGHSMGSPSPPPRPTAATSPVWCCAGRWAPTRR